VLPFFNSLWPYNKATRFTGGSLRVPGMTHTPIFQGKNGRKKNRSPLPDGRATPTGQGHQPEVVGLKEA